MGSICILTVLSPVILISVIALYLESGSPIVYHHKRVGKDGKEFNLYKIRSMVLDADKILWEQDPSLLEEYKKNGYKLKHDPRITTVGRILRRLDVDELPQFINVLKGEMSIVGPRAYKRNELEDQSKKYPGAKKYIDTTLTVKPGITGLWQVSGRNNVNFEERIKLDALYAEKWTILTDIKILFMTPFAVLRSHGD